MSNPNPPNQFKKGVPRPAGAGRRPGAVNHLTTARVKTECKVRVVYQTQLHINSLSGQGPMPVSNGFGSRNFGRKDRQGRSTVAGDVTRAKKVAVLDDIARSATSNGAPPTMTGASSPSVNLSCSQPRPAMPGCWTLPISSPQGWPVMGILNQSI